MPDEQHTSHDAAGQDTASTDTAVDAAPAPAYEPYGGSEEWLDEPAELPPRPRRRLLGAGGNPLALGLLAVLLLACGFIGGVLVEKGQTSSGSGSSAGSASSLASRFAALRGGTGGSGAAGATGSAGGGFAAAFAGAGGGTRPTAGTVAYLAGGTLYVTNSEGNTIKVKTSQATSVEKTVKTSVKAIHPGETVTITGTSGSSGAVSAESISVGAGGGGLAGLFGGAKASTGSSSGGGGEAALFGSG